MATLRQYKPKSLAFGIRKKDTNPRSSTSVTMTIPDAVNAIKDKLLYDSRSAWANSEVLYYINTLKRNTTYMSSQQVGSSTGQNVNSSDKNNAQSSKIRFLVLLKKKESTGNLYRGGTYYLLQITVRDNGLFNRTVDVKNSYDFRKIRGIDFNTSNLMSEEIVISVDKGEMVYTFSNQLERDETAWIIIQLCKLHASSTTDIIDTFAVGYSIDMEAISYTIVTNGTLNRFPGLNKLFSMNGLLNADAFGEEEAEAESLLDDLKWTTELGTSIDLQQTLAKQSSSLNMQIIDYLLQWEELDDGSSRVGSSSSSQSKGNSNNSRAPTRNTVEILDALNQVDRELEEANLWLNIQIERLSEIKSHLVLIEDESGGLESSYKNVQAIRDLINSVVSILTIEKVHETILRNPEPVITTALKVLNSTNSAANSETMLNPLVVAANKLLQAISFKGDENIVPHQTWKQIRVISAITEQKEKLFQLADTFVSKATQQLIPLFQSILKHKSVHDEINKYVTDVRLYKSSSIIKDRKFARKKQLEQATLNPSSTVASLYYCPKELNVLQSCQQLYHQSISEFMGLIEKLIQLSPSSTSSICKSYVETTHEKFYAILFKALMREYRTLMPASRSPITLATISRYQYKDLKDGNLIRFATRESFVNDSQISLLPPWELFAIFLLVATPVVLKEEVFFQDLFNIDPSLNETQAKDWLLLFSNPSVTTVPLLTETNVHMTSIFQTLIHLVHKLSAHSSSDVVTRASTVAVAGSMPSGSGHSGSTVQTMAGPTVGQSLDADVDIAETIGLLSVLYQFVYHYLDNIPSNNLSDIVSPMENGKAEFPNRNIAAGFEVTSSLVMLMYEIKGIFLSRLQVFQIEQIKWIQNQKCDIKKPGVCSPVAKYASLLYQIVEMLCGQVIEEVDTMVCEIAKCLLSWLSSVAQQNLKHADVFKLQNFAFLEELFSPSDGKVDLYLYFPSLKTVIDDIVIPSRYDAESKYVLWMISYEFGNLGAFANRIEKLGNHIRDDELILHLSSKEATAITKELDIKKCDSAINAIRKRLLKHCESKEDQELQVIGKIWSKIKIKGLDIFQKFSTVVLNYHINFDIQLRNISSVFDKYAPK